MGPSHPGIPVSIVRRLAPADLVLLDMRRALLAVTQDDFLCRPFLATRFPNYRGGAVGLCLLHPRSAK